MENISIKGGFLALSIMLLAGGQLLTEDVSAQEVTGDEIEEIVVVGVRGSILRAIESKYNDQGFSDSISAEDLGKFPDLNISESLQRIPGVTLNRNSNGEGEQINLRGLSPLFTRVEINGLTGLGNGSGASSNKDGSLGTTGGGRAFSFELLPAELFTTASIAKSASADQSEGGLAGVVALETPRALSHDGLKFTISAHVNSDDKSGSNDPRFFAAFSRNFDDRFGIAASIYRAESNFQSDSIESGNRQPLSDVFDAVRSPGLDGVFGTADDVTETLATYTDASGNPLDTSVLAVKTPRAISFIEDRENTAGNLNLQFRPNDRAEFYADFLYAELSSQKDVVRPDAAIEGTHTLVIGPNNPFTTANGLVTQATLDEVQYRPSTRQLDIEDKFVQFSVGGEFLLSDNWTMKPLIGFANREATRDHALLAFRANNTDGGNLDCSIATANAGCNGSTTAHYLTYSGQGTNFDFQSDFTNFDGNPENFGLNVLIFRPSVDEDEEKTFKLDFNRSFDDGALVSLDFGVRFNDKIKEVDFREYRLARTGGQPFDGFENVGTLVDFNVEGTSNGHNGQLLTAAPNLVFPYYFPGGFNEEASTGTITDTRIDNRPGRGAQQSYEVEEETLNFYVSADFEVDKLSMNVGLRHVYTDQTSSGSRVEARDSANEVITSVSVDNDYKFLLPSASLRYEYSEDLLFRSAYSTTLTRANLPQLSPFEQVFVSTVGADNGFINRGNPVLKPFTSDNFDIGLEWYFEEEGLLSFNYFHKRLNNFIGDNISREDALVAPQVACTPAEIALGLAGGGCDVDGRALFNLRVTTPVNAVAASIQGFEFGFQKPLSFFDGFGKDFGVLFNYTFAESSADFGNPDDVRADRLPGLSENSFNAGIYYDADFGDRGSLDARLNYAWRDAYLAVFADDFARPKFTDDYGQLDLSANYTLGNFRVSLQFLNITDEEIRFEGFDSGVGFYDYGIHDLSQRVLFGVQYTY